MNIDRVNPPELAPATGFSHAVRATGTTIFLAGQTALDTSGSIVGDGIVAQFEQALGNLLTALHAAGGTADQLASVTIYATDLAEYRRHARELGKVWQRLIGREYPAMAAIGVVRLWDDTALVEISGFAVRPAP